MLKVIHNQSKPVDKLYYVKLIMALTCTFVNKLSTYLTTLLRSGALRREAERVISKRRTRAIGILLCSSALLATTSQANAATSSDHYKLYLHSKILNYKQFTCAVEVGHRESRWNPTSTNGNHYGLFQMNNAKVKRMDAYTQMDWWIRYVHKRHHGSFCEALAHLKKWGWQ